MPSPIGLYHIFSTKCCVMLCVTVSRVSHCWHLSRCLLKLCIWKGAFGICTQRAVLQLSSALSSRIEKGFKRTNSYEKNIWHDTNWYDMMITEFGSLHLWLSVAICDPICNTLVVHRLHSKIIQYHSIPRPTALIHSSTNHISVVMVFPFRPIKASGGPWRNTKDNSSWDLQETNNTVLQCNRTLSSSDNPHGPGLCEEQMIHVPHANLPVHSTVLIHYSFHQNCHCFLFFFFILFPRKLQALVVWTRCLKRDRCALRILWVRCAWHRQAPVEVSGTSYCRFQMLWHGERRAIWPNSFQYIQHMRTTTCCENIAFVCFWMFPATGCTNIYFARKKRQDSTLSLPT